MKFSIFNSQFSMNYRLVISNVATVFHCELLFANPSLIDNGQMLIKPEGAI